MKIKNLWKPGKTGFSLFLLRCWREVRGRFEQAKACSTFQLRNSYYITEEDILQTWKIFQKFSDKDWSFTDCSSKFICEKFGITHAFSFDKHFGQFGTITVVP